MPPLRRGEVFMVRFVTFVGLMIWPALVVAADSTENTPTEVVPAPEVLASSSITQGEPETDGVLELKFNQVKPLKQRRPAIPAWSKLERPIVCKLDFKVDAAGIPLVVEPVECPESIQSNAIKASMKWRFEPHLQGNEAVPVKFRVVLKINH
jgi:hypothetical protein